MLSCQICKNKQIIFFSKINSFNYFRCDNCRTLFVYPQPLKKILNNYYKKNFSFNAGYQNENRTREQAKKIIGTLIKLNPKGKTLLDIGSGYGYFLEEAYKIKLLVCGIEPSERLYQLTSTCLAGRQVEHLIKVFNTNFENYYQNNKNKRFDFITLNHIIEHLENPCDAIEKISTLLNKSGILYIETPNLNSHLFNAEQKNYTFLTPPEHLWIFSQKSIQQIVNNISTLKIIKSSTYSYPEHLMGITKKKFQILNIKSQINPKDRKINKNALCFNLKLLLKKLKYLLLDKLIAPSLTPILNLGGYGSILEHYIKKK
ncbi:hypothetical protein COS31_03495 [Candidatus Roizmanbacteria bacterium CG02_land_8_20_14_3_00_36_15]|uniref:Methyltransferase n=2 Tax=Candidatus Roizmaniibacteriota TaxID=1752723 RepID=A0A2H0BYI9_9BACT|nr:MAG: hypothetical protein COW98_02240 [Candidatus Roizmanbacteria bacterium CG22_combo_CG10-13_8_21_14_all_35_9]PIV09294.1 MAG: hypothetical protein COS51_03705 [Candidatus Roizmanbacteria bacterium CG03_land_8_20_14_0_80_36_21]PIV37629.1 MAG: hypothetical protein COS31_03495 [Candidatus Roizmanbacteria bacterium CG02_land_8_20_14_3_00_36_15]PIY69958.1 MAG: hypothetical protein COY89_03855 [Candidatus Roizmanbacteria bacterium CG_4_10_14_0_8_um_filter_36_36]PJA53058.1 MAG: hypothetical prote